MNPLRCFWCVALFALASCAGAADGNRLTYLDGDDPFHPHRDFARLTTPQWVGEPEVEAAVILSIDDMRDPVRYEAFLRPILERLKRIDGRAPVSIMVNAVSPTNAQLQAWLKDGLSLEVHTLAHPCPCLAKGDFTAAANTVHGCVELMHQIPGNKPVAFRMPCCDSMNSASPRFHAEIFNRVNGAGQFLTIDSSVFCLLTTNDPALPRELVVDAGGREKFRKYFPAETNAITKLSLKNYAGYIEDYPYPYVVGNLCWQFPCMVPSDWEAFNLHGSTNPVTLADWKSALDAVVLKQGVFTFVFHPHGWSSPQQFVEFIDYAVGKHGKKVKFLTFKEAQERLDRNLLLGHPLRATNGNDNAVRILDVNNDGYMDVVVARHQAGPRTRVWQPETRSWREMIFPCEMSGQFTRPFSYACWFGVIRGDGMASVLCSSGAVQQAWEFNGTGWSENAGFFNQLDAARLSLFPVNAGARREGFRLRDLDGDGRCELVLGRPGLSEILAWSDAEKRWKKLKYALPRGTSLVDAEGRDSGLRFIDVNGDGYDDVLFSNEKEFSLHLFIPKANPRLMWEVGWNDQVWAGKRGESDLNIPMIVRGGSNRNNGVWFKNGAMWVQNEDTAHLPDKVDRRTFRELLTADQPPPLSPEQALESMRPRPGFKVELAAAEPLVLDPIAFEWGADGRLWVADMFDYPLGPRGDGKPGGKIKVLEDLDGDGRYDKATVFLDDVNFPTGVLPWRNGAIVAAAPEIFYAEDSDGDGKADKRTTLFTGFVEGNQQHRMNGFGYGLDNWIYGANGDSGGTIRSALKPGKPAVSIRSRDFRFRPDTGDFEAVEGGTQYGRHRDDWGNWFGNNNPVWLWHYFLPERYTARNPHLTVKTTKQMLARYENSGRVFPASRTRQRFNDHHHFNHVTSANSPMPYRDDLFGPEFATSVFISDPVHNLVHREVIEPDGVSFTSRRAADETNREFLASTDLWFRPTMLKTGPDGALYVADMYRWVIEHPEWIPDWMEERMDLRAGSDRGRIYRVLPEGAVRRPIPNLAKRDTAALVAALDSPNGWQRDTAQRLLVERQDRAAVEPLRKLVIDSERAKTRVQALGTLAGLGSIEAGLLTRALADTHERVREHAVQLSEPVLAEAQTCRVRSGDNLVTLARRHGLTVDALRDRIGLGTSPLRVGQLFVALKSTNGAGDDAATAERVLKLARALQQCAADPSPRVRRQLAFTMGEAPGSFSSHVLATLARQESTEELRMAILSSASRQVDLLLGDLFEIQAEPAQGASIVSSELTGQLFGLATTMNDSGAILSALEAVAQTERSLGWRLGALAGLMEGLEARNTDLRRVSAAHGPRAQTLADDLEQLIPAARGLAMDPGADERDRLAAIRLLARATPERAADLQRLGQLLGVQNSSAIQQAALAALARQKDRAAADVLLGTWTGQGPALRTDALNLLLSRTDWCRALLASVQKGELPAAHIGPAFQQKLLNHPDATVKKRATEIFGTVSKDRQALLNQYAGVAKLTGDVARGMALYRQQCATCHRLRGEGSEVGPDLGTTANKDVESLLVAILDPNRAVDWRYAGYTATTRDDREISGVIVAETANSLTLRGPGGRDETFLRADLQEFRSSNVSLMPEGLEKALEPQAMADLLAALRGQ